MQHGVRGAADHFQRFVEGQDEAAAAAAARRGRAEPERKDFWDSFSSLAAEDSHRRTASRSSAIGTAAMKPGPSGAGTSSASSAAAASTATSTGAAGKKSTDDGGWDDNW